MGNLKVKRVQVGDHVTASNNFTIYQPDTPNGTMKIGVGNIGSVTELLELNGVGELRLNSRAVAEHGSNGNGEYVRLYNGVQVCWNYISATGHTMGTAAAGGFISDSPVIWTFPAAFNSVPRLAGNGALFDNLVSRMAASSTSADVRWWRGNSTSGTSVDARLIAIGTWY